jgi:xylulokinase
LLLGLDIGTSGARCLAVDPDGKVLAAATAEYPLHSPRPGWTEQHPEDWWQAASAVMAGVTAQVEEKVRGIGLTGQMHGSVFLDRAGVVIRPALLWNDQRTASQAVAITERVGGRRLVEIAGNPALTGFQAPKILWLREQEPDLYDRVATVLLPKDYIRLRLTGEKATDVSDASGTLLLDLARRDWSEQILEALEIPRAWLPAVQESPQATGRAASLVPGAVVAAGAGDNAAAAVGNGIVHKGLASCSIGTSGVLFAHADELEPDPSGRLHTFCHAVPARYHMMGVTLAAGASLRWWRDLAGQGDYDAITELAATAPSGSEGLVFLPYLSGERSPHLDPRARGAFIGLTARHDRSHLTRAVMEGVAFSVRDLLEVMDELGVSPEEIRATGGGARSDFWRQLLADVLGKPIVRTEVDEGPAYGAALLAGVAAGMFKDVEEACSGIRLRPDTSEPDRERTKRYDEYFGVYRSLYSANAEAMHALTDLAGD